ncbi:hypothetical protein BJ878DRAFT_233823 [Calycina marina]|uniref:NmrA-like domain-containing protein n=1 Tax=Calycina marina TaxID=1763456 RepID=A0A9P7YXS0_9HELO|nr:hypothetical protein BJ878DRAFT_233823 [Calycina marina]
MCNNKEVIIIAGVGNLGKYLVEELAADKGYDVVVLSRKKSQWLAERQVDVQITDYTEESILAILDSTNCKALVSFLNPPGNLYLNIHKSLLNACVRSRTCKHFIPSEWIGNSEDYPLLPRFYGETREPFRKLLRDSSIQWTLFNGGWLMDYFLPQEKTHMPPIPAEFPVDPNNSRACIRGTGDELQSWTSARDIARAVVVLLGVHEWDTVTYVAGEWSTFNEAVKRIELFQGQPLETTYKSKDKILEFINNNDQLELSHDMEIALVEEWMISGAAACPREKTLLQKEKYFKSVKFFSLQEMLQHAEKVDFV